MRFVLFCILICCGLPGVARSAEPSRPVSFQYDVMPVLSKSGCNLGTCHGNKNGKGGLRLSLRGDDPARDYRTLTRDLNNRRANPLAPETSLLLLKPTMEVPHQGGRRFTPDDPEYRILSDWIAAGLPAANSEEPKLVELEVSPREVVLREPESQFSIEVSAKFADGSERDVTRLAVFEPAMPIVEISADGDVERIDFGETSITVRYLEQKVPVRVLMIPKRNDFVWNGPEPANFIDEEIFAKLKQLRVNPSSISDDTIFLRRVFFDLLGIPPTAEEAKQFVYDNSPDKRARLIDRLLERPEYAEHWALKWSDLLRNEEKVLDPKGVRNFHSWLRHAFATNRPFDEVVYELITARGSTYANPPANYYRAMREPLMRAESTAQLFLGVRLQCAKCHNHPFDRWTQNDYYGWANFFARVDYKILSNDRRDGNDKHQFDGEQLVLFEQKGSVKHPETGQVPSLRFLGEGDVPQEKSNNRLTLLAEWMTDSSNRRFAESQANRLWSQLLGIGIVDPIDDFRATNPASHPELLTRLGDEFASSGFDVKHLLRTILNSRTYQLSSTPTPNNQSEERNFAFAKTDRHSAEELLDAFSLVLDASVEFGNQPPGTRAGELPGVMSLNTRYQKPTLSDSFLAVFGKPPRLQSCECERSDETTLKQAFQLVSGPFLQDLLTQKENRVRQIAEGDHSPGEKIEQLYWSILSRPPQREEQETLVRMLGESSLPGRQQLEDIAWALLTSSEFLLRR